MNSFRAGSVTAACVCVLSTAAAAAVWTGESTMLGGTAGYDGGEWIHQDFVYDDYGADTTPAGSPQVVSLAPTTGDFRYPPDANRYANNAADILEVRVRASGADLEVRVTLNTLLEASSTVIGVGIDLGAGVSRPWPFEAGVSSVWERFLTVADGKVLSSEADTPAVLAAVDLAENTIEFVVPGGAADPSVALTIGSGLWDRATGRWLEGASATEQNPEGRFRSGGPSSVRVFDLAFNTRELEPRGGDWREDAQAEALRSGDVSAFRQTIEVARLADGSADPPIVEPGFYDRIFRSRQELGEGVSGGFPQYRGRHQPYGLWIPKGYDPSRPTPLVLLLHSLSVHHNQYAGDPSYNTMYEQLGDALGTILVTPLARGPDGWYWDEGLVDTLEAWEDVRSHYKTDPERTSSTGYSMGGYATYRLATMMPDRFAAAVSWVGPPAHQIWAYPLAPTPSGVRQGPGNTWFQLESTMWIPIFIVHGTNDELVPVSGVDHQAARLRELGYENRFDLHPGMDHFAFVFTDEWSRERDWLSGRTLVVDPPRVRFEVRPYSWATPGRSGRETILAHLESLGAELDSAYWVRDVVVAGEGDVTGIVDLTSEAISARRAAGADYVTAAPGPPTPFLRRGTERSFADEPVANRLTGFLESVSELTVDLARAGLTLDGIDVQVRADEYVVLHLVDGDARRDDEIEPTAFVLD